MGSEPTTLIGGGERELVSGEEIRRRVQARIDDHPGLRNAGKTIIAPMPKPAASEDATGCNWTMPHRSRRGWRRWGSERKNPGHDRGFAGLS